MDYKTKHSVEYTVPTIKFKTSDYELALVYRIVERAVTCAWATARDYNVSEMMMDIAGAHCNGCPLDLANLLACDEIDFFNDLAGIRVNVDHNTGELRNGFKPKFAFDRGKFLADMQTVLDATQGFVEHQLAAGKY